jgi:hypothetical protein
VRRSDRRKDTRIRSSVVRSTRVGDPHGADGRRQPHGAERLRHGSLIPSPRPRRAGRRRWSPGRRVGGSTRDHGRRPVRGTRPPSLTLVGPHGDTPGPRVGDGRPGRTFGKRSERGVGAWVGDVPRPPRPPPLRPRRPPRPPLPPFGSGGAPRREAGGEAEDGGGAATRAREVDDEGVVEAGVWWPRVSSSRARASRTCRKVGGGCWCVRSVRTAS